ncbi:kynurenine formamidase [Colletotrichum tofieldiae]|uniref:Kynurenine formamidase n=1 Tax=Colletotrichum tofieldiae TaxID=708197 RepID=A0A166NLP8_9PEZI|nr:kynurenine formamidase [Colletotrichum tofieldiae]GKT58971.1 kynurenine formamidase [Colletotrichum tofieldiae]GKT77605.1 kynurenine formamidase [Colletotrichum tofieldiae]GKT85109.1 kynurenine formamidase [Colletotrichum tofieldiae]
MSSSLKFTEHHYAADSELQKLGVWELAQNADNAAGYWVIYIHGGAWRDPRKTLHGFEPSIEEIVKASSIPKSEIRGFISIDYRLSPHPSFPQDPAVTPPAKLRCAQHPDHLRDVWSALAFLQREYDIQDRYILIGHSAGATLAFQLPMGPVALGATPPPEVKMPAAFVGVSGIYELCDFDARYGGNCTEFIVAAFGEDRESWNKVVPARFSGSFRDALPAQNLILLAWSPDDSLVDEPEIDGMASKLGKDGVECTVVKNLTHDHDFVWEDGKQIARLVSEALGLLRK